MAESNFDIWRLQSNSDVRGLLDAVREGSPDIRRRAITAIRALAATSAIPALQSILVEEKDAEVRGLLISTLDYLFQQEVDDDDEQATEQHSRVVQFIAQLNSDKPEQIIRAAQNLADLKEKLAAESLIVVFHNRALLPDVRLAAAEALIKLESAPVEITLLGALRHADWHHRRNAAAVLGQLSADWAVRPLAEALRDEQEIVRRTAFAALKRIGTPDALKAIEPPQTVPARPTVEVAKVILSPEASIQPSPTESENPVLPALNTSPSVEVAKMIVPPEAGMQSPTTEAEKPMPPTVVIAPPITEVVNPLAFSPAADNETLPTPPSLTLHTDAVSPASAQPPVTAEPSPTTAISSLEANAPIDDEDTQPSASTLLSDDVS